MRRYLLKRLVVAIPSLVIASLIIFTLPRLLPGDAVQLMLEEKAYGKDVDDLRHKLGLDRPIYIQYFAWLGQIGRGDLGESLWTKRTVTEELRMRLPVTLLLGGLAACFAVIIGIPIGVLSAVRADTLRDYAARSAALLGLSVPGFWLATLVIVLPAIWWGWTPHLGFTEFSKSPTAHVLQFILPAFILGIASGAAIMRLTRAMLSAQIFSATVIIENIFQLPGVGRFLFDAILQRDYPVIQGINLVIVSIIVLINLTVDLLYAVLDTRIRYS